MVTPIVNNYPLKFDILVRKNELSAKIASELKNILTTCEIVLLFDDSTSMQEIIKDTTSNKTTTKWSELKKLAEVFVDIITSVNPDGADITFFNRPTFRNVTNIEQIETIFNNLPIGDTPLISALRRIYIDKAFIPTNKKLLIVAITTDTLSDGTIKDLHSVLYNKRPNVYISFVKCSYDKEMSNYLDNIKNKIPNFDNSYNFLTEIETLKKVVSYHFKYDYTNFAIKILLSGFTKDYNNNIALMSPASYAYYNDPCDNCCKIL